MEPSAAPADSVPGDSVSVGARAARRTAQPAPAPRDPAGAGAPLRRMGASDVVRSTRQDPREALRDGLDLDFFDPGSAHTIEPLFLAVPGLITPEFRRDGIPEGPAGWPESPFLSVPLLEIRDAELRRYSPVLAPLSSTGGPVVAIRTATLPHTEAVSGARVTRANYETFSNEIVFRRPLGTWLFGAWFGDTKTAGRNPWRFQSGEAKGFRLGGPFAEGWLDLTVDGGERRIALLSTKKGNWNRTSVVARYALADSAGITTQVSVQAFSSRARWETGEGVTRRAGRDLFVRAEHHRPWLRDARASFVLEADYGRIRLGTPQAASRLLEDVSGGIAAGVERRAAGGLGRVAVGLTRLAPLAVAPVASAEWEAPLRDGQAVVLHASRAVLHRTVPRLPTDGEAWVLQGLDLVEEDDGEAPQSLWSGGIGWKGDASDGGRRLEILFDAAWSRGGLDLSEEQIALLASGRQEEIPSSALRGSRLHFLPQIRGDSRLPYGFRVRGAVQGTIPEEGWRANFGVAPLRSRGVLGWSHRFLKGDVLLDLSLDVRARSAIATPYGTLPSEVRLDGIILGRIGKAQIFFTLANLADTVSPSMSHEGFFSDLPWRHYRAGLRWDFLN